VLLRNETSAFRYITIKMTTEYVSQWASDFKEEALCRQSFLDMLDGKIPLIREVGLLSRDVAEKLQNILIPQMTPYLHATGPTLVKVGVAQFEFQALSQADIENRADDSKPPRDIAEVNVIRKADMVTVKERYFLEVEKHKHLHDELAHTVGQNVWKTIVDKLQSLFTDWEVVVAHEGDGKKYFSGIFRAINDSTPIHCDWSPYDSRTEDWIVNQVEKQAVFNLYVAPFKGGKTEVYDVQWTPDALKYRDPDSYGYTTEIIEGRAKATVAPLVGDLYFFNSRNMHQVFPVEKEENVDAEGLVNGKRVRLTLSSFLGTLPAKSPGEKPKLILWS
jgi:hypothetical protein